MAIWIEFRCENRDNPSAYGSHVENKRCLSRDNRGPMDLALDTNASVLEVVASLSNEANQGGWKKTRHGWICPYCGAQPLAMGEVAAAAV